MMLDDKLKTANQPWNGSIPSLQERIASRIPAKRDRADRLLKEYGSEVVDTVSVANLYGGNRGVRLMISDISHVEPYEGIRFRDYTIHDILSSLPKLEGAEYPLAGGLYYLLLVGDIPTLSDALMVEEEWRSRIEIPGYVFDVLKALPDDTHPMAMFSQAILSMQGESIFAKEYQKGNLKKSDYWETILQDSLNLTAKLPSLAAYIYRLKYSDGTFIEPDPSLDWSANFAHMIGKSKDADYEDYRELCRLFFVLHADHEGANASSHSTHLVASTLSDIYYSCSAGMNALAGPLHGLANQGCLKWILSLREKFGGVPSKEQLEEFAFDTLNSGQVIPGYGHAVLRITDPRFSAQLDFGKKHMYNDELFQLVNEVYEVVPKILSKIDKVKNPWPNVDAITGVLQYHYGITGIEIYTVLFGVSRILGISSSVLWSRILGLPIERPKSVTTNLLEDYLS